MSKTSVWLLISLLFLLGLAVGCANDCDCSQINNANLEVGDKAPDFRLPDHRGGYARLSEYKGKSNVIIAFFPAAFTPV
jgi:hypothetical protein